MALRSAGATIDFLLTAIDCVEGKIDWDAVAVRTGWYKGSKFSKQAFNTIRGKYAGKVIGVAQGDAAKEASSPNGPKSKRSMPIKGKVSQPRGGNGKNKKRTSSEVIDNDDDESSIQDEKKVKLEKDDAKEAVKIEKDDGIKGKEANKATKIEG